MKYTNSSQKLKTGLQFIKKTLKSSSHYPILPYVILMLFNEHPQLRYSRSKWIFSRAAKHYSHTDRMLSTASQN